VIHLWLAALIRSCLHGKDLELWEQTEKVDRLLRQLGERDRHIRDLDSNLAESRRTIAALRSERNRLYDFAVSPLDTLVEERPT
jgi:hypothetical protein